jgi:hypothetical protein
MQDRFEIASRRQMGFLLGRATVYGGKSDLGIELP